MGNQSVGIYSDSSDVINTGKIVMGDSIDSKNPSIGIYSKNGKVENFGELTTGNNSTGIYAKSVNVKENSKLNVGNNSVGIYSLGGTFIYQVLHSLALVIIIQHCFIIMEKMEIL